MKLADIEPGTYVRVRMQKEGGIYPTDTALVERIDTPRYDGDKARVVVTRFLVKGRTECRFAPKDVLDTVDAPHWVNAYEKAGF